MKKSKSPVARFKEIRRRSYAIPSPNESRCQVSLNVLLTLKNQLQEKSEQIVKLKGADLILRENEQLKEKDRQRENRLNEIKRSAEAEVSTLVSGTIKRFLKELR